MSEVLGDFAVAVLCFEMNVVFFKMGIQSFAWFFGDFMIQFYILNLLVKERKLVA